MYPFFALLNRMKYIDYLTQQPNFYKIMTIVMDMVIKCKGRVLIYIGTNESILRVYKWIGTNYPEFLGDIGIYTSLVDKKDNPIGFSKLSDVLIGNQYGSMIDMSNIYFGNAKVTTPDLNNIIYNASEDSGIIFMPVNKDGAPDYESLQRFNEANQIFEANKSN